MRSEHYVIQPNKDHLLAARRASLRHTAISARAATYGHSLLPILTAARQRDPRVKTRKPSTQALASQQLTLDAILADLILASGNEDSLGFFYRSSKRTSFTGDKTKASSRAYEWQIKALQHLGLIEVHPGFTKYDDFDDDVIEEFRKASRIRATPDLLQRAQDHGITHETLYQHYALERLINHQPMIVRAGKTSGSRGKMILPTMTPKAFIIQNEVERINAIYEKHEFAGLPEPQVYRGFNLGDSKGFGFNKGGRLYGEFQQTPKVSRRDILIDGDSVIELDLKAAHLTILYHITDTPIPEGDLYAIDGLPRPMVKAAITAMIGKGRAQLIRWSPEMRENIAAATGDIALRDPEAMRSRYPVKQVTERIVSHHPALLNLSPGVLDWADLQYLESQVLVDTILKLGEMHEVAALPIHDSIIVPTKDEEVSRWYLGNAFERLTGGPAIIETK